MAHSPLPFDRKTIAKQASEEASTLRYWFRKKYNLSPKDPRYLEMSDEEIHLEFEIALADDDKELKTCPDCGYMTHREYCPECTTEEKYVGMTGDAVIDKTFSKLAAGEEMSQEQFEAELRGQTWEPLI